MTVLASVLLIAASTSAADGEVSVPQPPNILIVLADDLGYSDLGCYGGEIQTPNIDALARHGVRFTQFYNSARCCPSRASLMTGLYPSQAGIGDFVTARPSPDRGPGYLGRLNDQCVTLAEVLKTAGYGCYYVGKWHMHEETGPIQRGFDEFYGYTRDHSHDQYDADYYVRLPAGRVKEIDPPAGEFYATDVFNAFAIEFVRQGQASGKPWFVFLGHSSPHFPIQAPAQRADKYEPTYLRGWDVLRAERFERMRKLGLIDGERWQLTARSLVPVDRDDIAQGFAGKENPAWESLDEDRRRDLARRMAVFAAMVETVDQGVGKIVEHLRATGDLDNTLILFLSDNGACYEWGPFGFDGESRRGTATLHAGEDVRKIGTRGTHHSYGSAWANLGNTPFRMYKHFTHEGGINTPCIAHWPRGIGAPDRWVRQPAHVMDVMPTLIEAARASYPGTFRGQTVQPLEGTSLLPAMRGERLPERAIGFEHQGARAYRAGDWKLVWSKRMPREIQWELYNLAEDPCETTDLAQQHPDRVQAMAAEWEQWARRVNVIHEPRSASRPNVLLILADDMGWSDLGCYGGEIPTPNLDALAKGGLRFTQFYNTARCSPTRAALLTGLLQHQAGMGILAEDPEQQAPADAAAGYRRFLNRNCATIAEVLGSAGYHTYLAGKWHLGYQGQEKWPLQRGFERYYGILAGASSYLRPQGGRGLTLDNTPLPPPSDPDYYTTDAFAQHLIQFVMEQPDERPFFAYLAFNAPHWPLHARPEDVARFVGRYAHGWDKLRDERWARQLALGVVKREWGLSPRDDGARAWDELSDPQKEQLDYRMAVYAAQVHRMDYQVGRVIDALRARGKLDNTLVMFLSDNGGCAEPYNDLGGGKFEEINDPGISGAVSYGTGWANASNTPFRRYKARLYEGGISTPLIVYWPAGLKAEPGSLSDASGFLSDIVPTLLDLTGAEYPVEFHGRRLTPLYGRSLAPVIQGGRVPQPEWMFWEHYNDRAARKGDWKILGRIGSDTWELYDLASDRTEQHDLAAEKPELVAEMAAAWQRWAETHAVLPRFVGTPPKKTLKSREK